MLAVRRRSILGQGTLAGGGVRERGVGGPIQRGVQGGGNGEGGVCGVREAVGMDGAGGEEGVHAAVVRNPNMPEAGPMGGEGGVRTILAHTLGDILPEVAAAVAVHILPPTHHRSWWPAHS